MVNNNTWESVKLQLVLENGFDFRGTMATKQAHALCYRVKKGTKRRSHATYANVSLVPSTRSIYSFSSKLSMACNKVSQSRFTENCTVLFTFLMSGIFGANRCEICDITSWIRGWFFIVLRAFMILKDFGSALTDAKER
jgi:hypothetical protein